MISEKSLLQGFMKSKEKYMFSEQDFWEKKLFLPWKNTSALQAILITIYINRKMGLMEGKRQIFLRIF